MTKQGGSDKCLQIFEGRIHWGGRDFAVRVIPGGGIRSKSMESKKKKNSKRNQTHKAKIQLKDRQAKLPRKVKYIHIPHVGDVKFSSETGNSVYKTYGKPEWVHRTNEKTWGLDTGRPTGASGDCRCPTDTAIIELQSGSEGRFCIQLKSQGKGWFGLI